MATNPELSKYETVYSDPVKYGGYGVKMHGWNYREAVLKARSVIDVGCGMNGLMQWCREHGDGEYLGMDFACEQADVVHDVTERSGFSDAQFELVTAFDVLEHLRPEQVSPALNEMRRISRCFLFTIADYDCGFRVDGEPLHQTIRSHAWWSETLGELAQSVTWSGDVFCGAWNVPA